MVFEDSDLVVYKKDGKIYGGGFTVNSIMLQHGISPITRVNGGGGGGSKKGVGGTLDDSFSHLAIPAGLYYFDTGLLDQSGGGGGTQIDKDFMKDDMYSKLMELAWNVNDEYVGGDGDYSELDSDEMESESKKPTNTKKHKKTKRERLTKEKGRKTRKN